jgi:4-amino-4-deoxy-L-arabinose transferase-like glycosyltransferase
MRHAAAGIGSGPSRSASCESITIPDGAVWLLIALGVLLRVAWIGVVDANPVSDSLVYLERASSIADGFGYATPDHLPTAYWPVGYPAFLGLMLAIGGRDLIVAKLANILIYAATAGLLHATGKQLRADGTGFLAVAYVSLSPNHVSYANLLASEPLALLTVAGTFHAFVRLGGARRPLPWLAAGCASFVLGVYVKPQILWLPLVLAIATCALQRNCAVLRRTAVFYVALVIAASPWVYRNHNVFGGWMLISTNSGVNLLIGNNPLADGSWVWNADLQAQLAGLNEAEADRKARALAGRHILEHPWRTVTLALRKQVYLWATDWDGVTWNAKGMQQPSSIETAALAGLKILSQLIYMCCLGISVCGLIRHWKRRGAVRADSWLAALPLAAVLYYSSLHSLFFGTSRFHFVFVPLLLLYGDELLVKREARSANRQATPTPWGPNPSPGTNAAPRVPAGINRFVTGHRRC